MKGVFILSMFVGFAYCQIHIHGHDLNVLIEKAFNRLDLNHNGQLEDSEFETAMKHGDTNGDGMLSCDEYVAMTSQPKELALEIFHHMDGASNDCLIDHADVLADLRSMDQTGDGIVNEHEFEHYYVQILKHLGHIDHGHHHG